TNRSADQRALCAERVCARQSRTPPILIQPEKVCAASPAASARSDSPITKSSNANSSFTTRSTQNANARSAAVKRVAQAGQLLRAETQSGHSARRHLCHWRGRRALDAFCAEVPASGRRNSVCYRPL